MKIPSSHDQLAQSVATASPKKAYRAPQVATYGPLVRLTNATTGSGGDTGGFLPPG